MGIDDSVLAALRQTARRDLQDVLCALMSTHGHESIEVAVRLAAVPAAQRIQVFGRGRMKASDFPDVEADWPRIWFGLYPGSITYLCGETGAGKSSLLYNLCIHGARNEDLWNLPFGLQRPLHILYIDPENAGNFDAGRPGLCLQKLTRIGQGKPHLLEFHDGQGIDLSKADHMQQLEDLIVEEKIDLVVLDPIINLFGTADENDNAEAGKQFSALKAMTKRTNCAVIAVHHTGKDNSGIFGRGATARLGAADVGMVLRVRGESDETDDDYADGALRERDDVVRLQMVKNRLEPGKASVYLQMAGEDRFERVGHEEWKAAASRGMSEQKPKRAQAQDEIYAFLVGGPERSTDEIKKAMLREGVGESNTEAALKFLVSEGTISRRKEGRGGMSYYCIPSPGLNFRSSVKPLGDYGTTEVPNERQTPSDPNFHSSVKPLENHESMKVPGQVKTPDPNFRSSVKPLGDYGTTEVPRDGKPLPPDPQLDRFFGTAPADTTPDPEDVDPFQDEQEGRE